VTIFILAIFTTPLMAAYCLLYIAFHHLPALRSVDRAALPLKIKKLLLVVTAVLLCAIPLSFLVELVWHANDFSAK
jgi:hypothetical protein